MNENDMWLRLTLLLNLLLLLNTSCVHTSIDKQTVDTLDISRYMGKWFEIARFEHRFQHHLVGSTIEYTLLPDGTIEVLNSGYCDDFSGAWRRAKGIAHIPDPAHPGKMRISFFLKFHAEYNIMEIDEKEYSYALIGSNTSDYLWLISRTPYLSSEAARHLLQCARKRGYDISLLKWVKQRRE